MNESKDEGEEAQISLADMKLLITAVISFDPGQIVSAFLDVQRLRETLISKISVSSNSYMDEAPNVSGVEDDLSMMDRMQSVFLRPDTPIQADILSLPHSQVSHPPLPHNRLAVPLPPYDNDLTASTDEDSDLLSRNLEMNAVSIHNLVSTLSPASTVTSVSNSLSKKGSKLDQLLRNNLAASSTVVDENSQRHALCTKQVAHVVEKSSMRMLKPRKRKNALPRYNPYQSTSPYRRLSTSPHNRKQVSDKIARLLDCDTQDTRVIPAAPEPDSMNNQFVESESTDTVANEHASINTNPGVSKEQSVVSLSHSVAISHGTSIINSTGVEEASAATHMQSQPPPTNDRTVCSTSIPLTETLNASVGRLSEQEKGHPPCGPFITHSQSDLLSPLPPTNDIDLQMASSNYTENVVTDPIDLSSLMLGEQGLGTNVNDVSLFVDTPQPQPSVVDLRKAVRPKTKKKKTGNLDKQLAAVPIDLDKSQTAESSVSESESKKSEVALLRLRCRRCSERFTSKTDYQLHLKSQICSTGYTQTYTCQVCGYCALTRQRLIVHMRTHSGERPHRCPFCSYAATQQAPLKRHMQNIHLKAGAISLTNPKQTAGPPVNS